MTRYFAVVLVVLFGLLPSVSVAQRAPFHALLSHTQVRVQSTDPTAVQEMEWGLDASNVTPAWKATKGAGITVCSVDTGVSESPSLLGSVIPGANFANPLKATDTADGQGHGTYTSSLIAGHGPVQGVAPAVKILAVKALGDDGSGSTESVTGGIIYCVTHGASVVNLSLGGSGSASDGLKDTIDWACAHGVDFAFSAGNDGVIHSGNDPASVSSRCALTVTAYEKDGLATDFTNYGDVPAEVSAPGQNIIGDSTAGPFMASGTSASAPFVTGTLALLRALGANQYEAPLMIEATVQRPKTIQGIIGMYGLGKLNTGKAVALYLSLRPQTP